MEKFKQRWEIQKNWQLLFPFLGVLVTFYSSYKLFNRFAEEFHFGFKIVLTFILTYLFIRLFLFLFKKLENKWKVTYKWEMIAIFMVFAITGSSSLFVGRPLMKWIGITKENLNITIYWILYIIIGLIFYQILLVTYGWLFGQHKFFWEFEKKMLKRFGLGRFLQ
ncbi:hypothetical protein KO494_03795 [Lacinutrix sp. C3R15]|uniref:DUF6787 family protein n=1 Tax=Flavobacteriaceae TaxID=49546 RepID=UPI001C09AF91|nr:MULTISPECIES: DUF6787 family protein [Flavobacteriaceae]MBU2938657.1 hypothetical protein [Lacinutrix sp. C3R15]MDO6621971.1 hypothetical protein [Oceanihabitans sp. 1_MG-2023]